MQATIWHHMKIKRKQKGFKSQIRKSEKGKVCAGVGFDFWAGGHYWASRRRRHLRSCQRRGGPTSCSHLDALSSTRLSHQRQKDLDAKIGRHQLWFLSFQKKVGNSNLLAGGNVVGWVVQTPASRLTPLLTLYF